MEIKDIIEVMKKQRKAFIDCRTPRQLNRKDSQDTIEAFNRVISFLSVESNVDVISRKEVLNYIKHSCCDLSSTTGELLAMQAINDLPAVRCEGKIGHWIEHEKHPLDIRCSCCNMAYNIGVMVIYKHCPNCGAKMVEEESGGSD